MAVKHEQTNNNYNSEESGIINHNHYFLRQSIKLKKVHTTKSGTIDVRANNN